MHQPTVREVAIPNDRPWELGGMHYSTVLRDGGRFKMWYRSDPGVDSNRDIVSVSCYAESDDGVVWEKPSLGLLEVYGTTENNVFYPPEDDPSINPSVIVDPRRSGVGAVQDGEPRPARPARLHVPGRAAVDAPGVEPDPDRGAVRQPQHPGVGR